MKGMTVCPMHLDQYGTKYVPQHSEVSFSIDDVDFASGMVTVNYAGAEYSISISRIAATQPETIADIDFMLSVEDEMRKHEKILIIEFVGAFANPVQLMSLYMYENETLDKLPAEVLQYRTFKSKLAKQLALNMTFDMDVTLLLDSHRGCYELGKVNHLGMFIAPEVFYRPDMALKTYYQRNNRT